MMRKNAKVWLSLLVACTMLTACGGGNQSGAESSSSVKTESVSEVTEEVSAESVSASSGAGEATEVKEEVLSIPVLLTGGTGKATVESPTEVRANGDGTYTAVLYWSSPNYDFMMVDGVRYDPVNTDGNSVFEIPIPSVDCSLEVQADTVAMSTPHLIDYTLYFGNATETNEEEEEREEQTAKAPAEIPDCLNVYGSMELLYATGFTVDYCDDGYTLVTIAGTDQYLIVPEKQSAPEGLPDSVTVLQMPIRNIYLVSSSAMDMFVACDAMDSLAFCGLEESGWYIEEAKQAMQKGSLKYAGKYSAPDYEALLAGGCELAIENRMITHSPEVLEELANLGIPSIVEQASYETTPQGRMEWIRLYGILTDHSEEADEAFLEQIAMIDEVKGAEETGLKVAYFYVTTNKLVSIRNANDYIPQMISIAGGEYAFSAYGVDSNSSTSTIQIEEFYATALDADILIYNSSIAGGLDSLKDFLDISPLFSELKAVKNGQVYCTQENLYQSSMEMGEFTSDLNQLLQGDTGNLKFLYLLD